MISLHRGTPRTRRSVAVVLCLLLGGCGAPPASQSEFVLGTVCTVNLYDHSSAKVYGEIFTRLREIENRMSVTLKDTDLERINAQAGIEPVQVHGEVIEVLERALFFGELTEGAFDPTVGSLTALWGIGGDHPRVPGDDELRAALALTGRGDVQIDRAGGTVFLTRPGMRLDLGAIAKGYAADETARIIGQARVKRALIDLGGNILVYGTKADKSPWRVGIQDPRGTRGAYVGIMEVRDKSLVTSGVYERYFDAQGKRYHHILSTLTGYPVDNGLLSVTIITGKSMDADALSTGVFALGYERGKALVESLEDTEALFIFEDLSVRGTPGALEHFTLTDGDYRVEP